MMTTTSTGEFGGPNPCLLLAFELGQRAWKLGLPWGLDNAHACAKSRRARSASSRTRSRAMRRFGLPAEAPVISCYEAGQDGFWLHRYLLAHGITNHVVDFSSIEVNRGARRAKTYRLDLGGLLSVLARYVQGDRRVWRIVRVPTVTEEDARQLPRTLETLTADRKLKTVRLWDGTPMAAGLCERLGAAAESPDTTA